jgi:hypothetical protein
MGDPIRHEGVTQFTSRRQVYFACMAASSQRKNK